MVNAKARIIGLILFDCVFTSEIEMTIDDEKDPRKTRSARRKTPSTRSKTKTLGTKAKGAKARGTFA